MKYPIFIDSGPFNLPVILTDHVSLHSSSQHLYWAPAVRDDYIQSQCRNWLQIFQKPISNLWPGVLKSSIGSSHESSILIHSRKARPPLRLVNVCSGYLVVGYRSGQEVHLSHPPKATWSCQAEEVTGASVSHLRWRRQIPNSSLLLTSRLHQKLNMTMEYGCPLP